jgi:DNA mismatch repair ATPase MutL
VRFVDQRFVHQAVFSSIRNALEGQRLAPEVRMARESYEPEPVLSGPADGAALAEALFSSPAAAPAATPSFFELADEPPAPLGQLRSSYIVAADGETLWLIDQHAAHERILYEDLVERGVSQLGQQLLLTPLPLELTPSERVTLEEELSDLASFGYDIEPFGDGDFVLRAVPASLSGIDPVRLVRSALSERERDCRSSTVREAGSRIAARIACHAAIKVNFELAPEKMRYLVRELWRARQPTVCPHGRPTTLRIGRDQIERGFGRS